MTTDVPLLEARGLVVGHRTPLLRGVDLALHAGEAWFVLGDNGSGKTTLVATLLGLLPPLGGELRRRADVRHRTGYVPQDLRGAVALPIMAGEFVATAVGDRVPHGEASERVVHALDRVRASGLASRDVRTLSQGERRRVAIARALARDPVLLVVDEPLANLDEQTAAALAADLAGLRRAGICVVHVAHNRALARTTATHVAVVRGGAVEAGAAASMFVGDPA